MADYNSSLPVRTENPGDVAVKISDATVPSQQVAVSVGGALSVAAASLPLPTGASTSALQTSGNASLSSIDTKTPALGQALAAASVPVVLTAAQLATLTPLTSVTVTQATGTNLHTVVDSGTINSNIRDATGTAFSSTNPLPVTLAATAIGTEVNDFNQANAIAVNGTSNHDYAVTAAKTFKGRLFWVSGSGKVKAEVQISLNGTVFTTKWVGFNSTANPNIAIELDLLSISDTGTGAIVRIIRTNIDQQAQNLYSTISGTEA